METIIHKAFQVFKKEGVEFDSLGVALLVGSEENSANLVERLLCFVYEHLDERYGFWDLSRAKEKYNPTQWLPSYHVYLPIIPTPEMFYAVVRIQSPQEIWDQTHFLQGPGSTSDRKPPKVASGGKTVKKHKKIMQENNIGRS